MYIPMIYRIETVDNDLLQDVLMGNISMLKAHELKAEMLNKKKIKKIVLIICIVVFVLCIFLGLSYERYQFDDGTMIALLIGLFAALFVAIFQFPGLVMAIQYLGALKNCRPGSDITFIEYRKYNLGRKNKQVFQKIESYTLNLDEARGLLNMADYNHVHYKNFAIFSFAFGAFLMIVAFVSAPFIITIQGETASTLRFLLMFPRVMAAIMALAGLGHLYRIGICNKYINAIIAAYFPK